MTTSTKVLLTGARGFIGAPVFRQLREAGVPVIGVSGSGCAQPDILQQDILLASEDDWRKTVEEHGFTHCIHTAWYTNPADYLVADVNVDWFAASQRLTRGFVNGGGKRFVALGSCLEYDPIDQNACDEELTPVLAINPYTENKLEFCRSLSNLLDNQVWMRVFFVYGPGDRPTRLVPHLLATIASGEIASPRFGGLRRDYIHVDDLAGQIIAASLGDVTGILNTGTGQAPSLSDIARACGQALDRVGQVKTNELVPDGSPGEIRASIARFERYVCKVRARPIEVGITDLVKQAGVMDKLV